MTNNSETKKRIAVLFGSRSCEREVSIISAIQMMRYINPERYEVIPVYIDETGSWYTGEALRNIQNFKPFNPDQKGIQKVFLDLTSGSGALMSVQKKTGLFTADKLTMVTRADVFFLVMHGLNGEDGTLQGLLELANVPYTSTGVVGSAVGMDKIIMKQFFLGAGLPVLPGEWYTRTAFEKDSGRVLDEIAGKLSFPVFVKPANLGSSIGVSRADNREELKESLEIAFEYDRRVLVEKGLDKPIELNCSVVGYDDETEASPIEMPLTSDEFLDFSEKYLSNGGSKGMASLHRVLPAPIEDELRDRIQEMSCRIFRMMDCKGVVRIDYMFDRNSGELYITEINTIPGSLAYYLWENKGLSYEKLIDRMIRYAETAHEDKNRSNYAFTSDILRGVTFGAKGAKGNKLSGGKKF